MKYIFKDQNVTSRDKKYNIGDEQHSRLDTVEKRFMKRL